MLLLPGRKIEPIQKGVSLQTFPSWLRFASPRALFDELDTKYTDMMNHGCFLIDCSINSTWVENLQCTLGCRDLKIQKADRRATQSI